MPRTEIDCPLCHAKMEVHPTLFGFDVAFFRCGLCGKNYSRTEGNLLDVLHGMLCGKVYPLGEVDDQGQRVKS